MSTRRVKSGADALDNIFISEDFRRKFADYCLMDDYYMSLFFKDDTASAQCVLRVILDKPDLKVESAKTQEMLFGTTGRRAVLDVLATDSVGTIYDIEVQRTSAGADLLRARYYSGVIDANALPAGADYTELREKYIIFITETDVLNGGLPIYHIGRTVAETGCAFSDGEHIFYVNGSCRNAGTALGRLMQDFFCRSVEGMHYEELKKRTRELKEPGEVNKMSDVIRELIEKGIEQEREECIAQGMEKGMEKGMKSAQVKNVRTMLGRGFDMKEISECLSLSIEDVKAYAKAEA